MDDREIPYCYIILERDLSLSFPLTDIDDGRRNEKWGTSMNIVYITGSLELSLGSEAAGSCLVLPEAIR